MAAVERNSDGSYDAVDSGGFGKDYHGQDAFGERIGGTGIGGSHFGGFEEGHVGLDKDNTGHYEKLSSEALAQTESMPKSAFEADNGNESEEEAGSGMRDSLRGLNSESSEESSNTDSMDTSFQIGGTEENEAAKEKYQQRLERKETAQRALEMDEERLNKTKEWADGANAHADGASKSLHAAINALADKSLNSKIANRLTNMDDKVIDGLEKFAEMFGYDFDRNEIKEAYKERGTDALREATDKIFERRKTDIGSKVKKVQDMRDLSKSIVDLYESSTTDKTKTSFTDKVKEDKPKETNMSKATPVKSDYETKANKDSTKEVPNRNDFGNHAVDTLKGATDRIADSFTAKSLGLKSVEEFARENGYDPNKLSTMKAYQAYQNKEIVKAIPNVMKKVGGYIVERIKDAFDPSQLPERVRNTLARYNVATLVGAAILSINSGAGLQASIDQALTMVDTEDQPAVSDFLEDVLKDRDTVKDLSNAVDGALAPEENSVTRELDEEIVNIGRKNNTDYDDFNAGLGTTTSDADVKVFIARNIKADPILRRMVGKLGK